MNHPAWKKSTTVQIVAQTQSTASLSWTGRSRSVPLTRMKKRKKRKGQGGEEDLFPSPKVQHQLCVSSHWTNGHHMASLYYTYMAPKPIEKLVCVGLAILSGFAVLALLGIESGYVTDFIYTACYNFTYNWTWVMVSGLPWILFRLISALHQTRA